MILSPMATGNGAYIVHQVLEKHIPGYRLLPYSPLLTFFPLSLYLLGRRYKADVLHTTADYALFLQTQNTPTILTLHNYVLDPFMKDYSSILQKLHYQTDLRWFTKRAWQSAHKITAVSHFTAKLAQQDLASDKEVQVIYNGIDEQNFTPDFSSQGNKKKINVLFSGNLSLRKGVQWLPSIADKLLDNITIFYTSGLRNHGAIQNHPKLKCIGRVPHQNMPGLYRQMDILLFPSVREGYGLAAAEAMSCGLPVIASNASSLPELVDNGKGGYLCPIGNSTEFAKRINQLATDVKLRRLMGEYNREKVEQKFTLTRMLAEYTELFETLGNTSK